MEYFLKKEFKDKVYLPLWRRNVAAMILLFLFGISVLVAFFSLPEEADVSSMIGLALICFFLGFVFFFRANILRGAIEFGISDPNYVFTAISLLHRKQKIFAFYKHFSRGKRKRKLARKIRLINIWIEEQYK